MKYLWTVVILLYATSAYCQTEKEPENKVCHNAVYLKSKAMEEATRLLELDSLNYRAIRYFTEYYEATGNKDSIDIFFWEISEKYPDSHLPYFYRVKFDTHKELTDLKRVIYLQKAHDRNPAHYETAYMLATGYYTMFLEEYKNPVSKSLLEGYAQNGIRYLEKAYIKDGRVSFPLLTALIHLYSYQGRTDKVEELTDKLSDENQYFPILAFASVSTSPEGGSIGGIKGVPADWQNDYTFDMIKATESSLFCRKWYSKHLSAMEEPPLWRRIDEDRIRFTWLRTFDAPVIIRITNKGEFVTINYKATDGQGGYEPGHLVANLQKELGIEEWGELTDLLEKYSFWEMLAKNEDYLSFDGEQWILEANIGGKYHVVEREGGGDSLYKICIPILDLSGIEWRKKLYN